MATYYYPSVGSSGYRWNVLQRVYNTAGIEPLSLGDVGEQTYLEFSRELTEAEKAAVDAVMADNPTYPPASANTVFTLMDVWNRRAAIAEALGLDYDLYYNESVQGSGDVDLIEIHFKKQLSEAEIQMVYDNYPRLLNLK
jgi:hypothetical protein